MRLFYENNYCVQPVLSVDDSSYDKIVILYPKEFIGDLVLEENIPKMLSVVREYIKESESYSMFKNMIESARWDSEKLKYDNIAYVHKLKADKLAEKMNEGISPYAWYVGKVCNELICNGIRQYADYIVCLEKI